MPIQTNYTRYNYALSIFNILKFEKYTFKKYCNHDSAHNMLLHIGDIKDIEFVSIINKDKISLHYKNSNGVFLFVMPFLGKIDVMTKDGKFSCRFDKQCSFFCGINHAEISISPYSNIFLVLGKQSDIISTLTQISGCDDLPPLLFKNPISFEENGPSFFRNLLDNMINSFENIKKIENSGILVSKYKETLITAILTCLPHNCAQLLQPMAQQNDVPRVVRLAEKYMRENSDKPLQLRELTQITGSSVRSIQASFKRFRGYTPTDFLRRCRLNKARCLLQVRKPATTILSVALACGFTSQSHFCKCYRKQFGERAMDTLRHGP